MELILTMAAVSKNKLAWRCVQTGDSPYFSLKSSFTCSRRITFSPSLLASSSSAKQKRAENNTLLLSEPLESPSHCLHTCQCLCPPAPVRRGDSSEAAALHLHLASPYRAVQRSYKTLPNLHLPRAAMAESILHPLCRAVNDCKLCKVMETQALSATNAPTSDIKE